MSTDLKKLYADADGWGEKTMDHPSGIWGRRIVLSYLHDIIKPGDVVLDLGCGGGFPSAQIVKMVGLNGQVIGVEIHDAMLSKAKKSFGNIPNLTFLKGDITKTLPDIKADVVVSFMVLPNLRSFDVAKVFANTAQVIKDHGKAIFLATHHDALVSAWDMDFMVYDRKDLECFWKSKEKEDVQIDGVVKNSSGGKKLVTMFNHTRENMLRAIESAGLRIENELDLWIDQETAEKEFGQGSVRKAPVTPTFWMLDVSRSRC